MLIHAVQTLALRGGDSLPSHSVHIIVGVKIPGTSWIIRVWMEPRLGLDHVEKRKMCVLDGNLAPMMLSIA